MARLIDADALIEAWDLQDCVKYGNETAEQQNHSYSSMMLYEIKDMIDDAPTVDAVEVVRCKDCAKSRRIDGDIKRFCRKTKTLVMPRGFCSGGFKR